MSENEVDPDAAQLDAVLWAAWKAMELPEGYRAEIIEGAIEVQRIGRVRHALIANRLSEALPLSQREDAYAAYQAMAVTLGRRRVWMPDVLVASAGSARGRRGHRDCRLGRSPCRRSGVTR